MIKFFQSDISMAKQIMRLTIKQQNLMTTCIEKKQQSTPVFLRKDPHKVGKLFLKKNQPAQNQQNPEQNALLSTAILPKEIGVNTSRIGVEFSPQVELIVKNEAESNFPQEQHSSIKMYSSVFDFKYQGTLKSQHRLQQVVKTNNSSRSPVGSIRRQPKSAPKDSAARVSETFSQLPSINKIQRNVSRFRSFVDTSVGSPSHGSGKFYSGLVSRGAQRSWFRKSQHLDSEENQKLEKYKTNRVTNNSQIKLPTFRDQTKSEYQRFQSTSKLRNTSKKQVTESEKVHKNPTFSEINPLTHSSNPLQQKSYFSNQNLNNNFVVSRVNISQTSYVSIDLRTSTSRLKQILVESGKELHVSFIVPQIFFSPPSSDSTSQELHMLMLQVFSHVGITPQIVSIKKYVNCVVLRERDLSIVWNFNGKIYFGGWQRGDNLSEGNKHGIGIEWVPARYIFYGEFKDNKKEGYGIMKKSNKEVYVGCWKNNQRWGWGKLYESQGLLHQNGQFAEGCFVAQQ